ncbi:MAG TPA: hypothetical protein VHC95_07045 [Opitutales bacterium]|nr:hypothetical protein [Opitutales bacterium]
MNDNPDPVQPARRQIQTPAPAVGQIHFSTPAPMTVPVNLLITVTVRIAS